MPRKKQKHLTTIRRIEHIPKKRKKFNKHYFWGGFVWLIICNATYYLSAWMGRIPHPDEASIGASIGFALTYIILVYVPFVWFIKEAGG